MGTGSFPAVKRPGRGADHPPPSRAEDEGRVELYVFSPSGPSWPVIGRALPLTSVLPFSTKLGVPQRISTKVPNMKFNRNPSSKSRADTCGQTDVHDEVTMCFSRLWERFQKHEPYAIQTADIWTMSLPLCEKYTPAQSWENNYEFE